MAYLAPYFLLQFTIRAYHKMKPPVHWKLQSSPSPLKTLEFQPRNSNLSYLWQFGASWAPNLRQTRNLCKLLRGAEWRKICHFSFNRNICGNISRQWRALLLSEIFHELFRAHMRIKVNILTRQSRVNNNPGWQNFWGISNPGCPKAHGLSQPQFHGSRHPLGVFRWIFQSRGHCAYSLSHSVNS